MAVKEMQRLRKEFGGLKGALKAQERLNDDIAFLLANLDGWRAKYPNRWVAVYEGELVAVADTVERLLEDIERKGLPVRKAVIDFIAEKRANFIL
ncbi:MAG: DUF5678 domain-containing protein [Dehalococcoidia bacterium]